MAKKLYKSKAWRSSRSGQMSFGELAAGNSLQWCFRNSNTASFGGDLQKGQRKTARPISTKSPMHIVIKARSAIFVKALAKHTLAKHKAELHTRAKRHGVKLYGYQFNGNHVHLVAKFLRRHLYVAFIRDLTGTFARTATLASETTGVRHAKGVFIARPFTRIVKWGRDFKNMTEYLFLNSIEAKLGVDREAAKEVALTLAWGSG
jgi:hypothetical protein